MVGELDVEIINSEVCLCLLSVFGTSAGVCLCRFAVEWSYAERARVSRFRPLAENLAIDNSFSAHGGMSLIKNGNSSSNRLLFHVLYMSFPAVQAFLPSIKSLPRGLKRDGNLLASAEISCVGTKKELGRRCC